MEDLSRDQVELARSTKQTPNTTEEDQDKKISYFYEYLVSSGCIISVSNYHFIIIGRLTNFQWETIEEWIKLM